MTPKERRRSLPLLPQVVGALAIVGLLPFAIGFFQIRDSRAAMIEQVQLTHLAAARAAADRVAAYLELLGAVGRSAVDNPNLAGDPASVAAQEVLTGILVARPELVAAATYLVSRPTPELVQMARRSEHREAVARLLRPEEPQPVLALRQGGGFWIRLRLPAEDPSLVLLLLAETTTLAENFVPVELGEGADLVLADRSGEVLWGNAAGLAVLPETVLAKARSGLLMSGADQFRNAAGERRVGAYAAVADSPFFVVSTQPSRIAEVAADRMRRSTWQAFSGVFLVTVLLSLWAQRSLVRPLRGLARAQRRLAGVGAAAGRGGEIAQLEEAFTLLERHLHDREALGRVFLGRFQVVELLGVGAMGTVFRGFDPKLQRPVALKTLKIGGETKSDTQVALAGQLVQEAVTLARLQHPHIVTVYDVADAGAQAFIAMELVEGTSLEAYLVRHGELPVEQVVPLGAALFQALAAAHAVGFVHHDVKPANILLGSDGAIKVTDFGIAEVLSQATARRDVICGTPGYLPPESLEGEGYDERGDLFAAGVVLYECLSGTRLFPGRSVREVVTVTLRCHVEPIRNLRPAVPAVLAELVHALLRPDPDDRPPSAVRVAEELQGMAAREGMRWSIRPLPPSEETRLAPDRPSMALVHTRPVPALPASGRSGTGRRG